MVIDHGLQAWATLRLLWVPVFELGVSAKALRGWISGEAGRST